MKKIFAAIAFLVITTGTLQAQRTNDSTHHAKKHGMKTQHQQGLHSLNLTDAQKEQTRASQENFRKQATDLRNNTSLTQEERKKKLMELRKEQHQQMQSILTTEQKESFKAQKKEHKKNRHAEKMEQRKQGGKDRDTKK